MYGQSVKASLQDPESPTTVVGYVRVSTEEQAKSDAGLEAQRHAIKSECDRRGWTLLALYEDNSQSGRAMTKRPALAAALADVAAGRASAVVVAKLDRLSRSLPDAASLFERARSEGWKLVALDLALDMTTPQGEVMAHIMAAFAQFERRLIGQRTKDALAAVRSKGVRLGRPPLLANSVVDRIIRERDGGRTLRAISDGLRGDRVPTATGGAWHPSTIAAVLRSARTGRRAA
jgi:DNA invertase Pin-like site-specific DNA recombinase